MFKWLTCYLSGQHDYKVSCEPGAIFLSCHHCGRRSTGWELQRDRAIANARLEVGQPAQAIAPHARGLQ